MDQSQHAHCSWLFGVIERQNSDRSKANAMARIKSIEHFRVKPRWLFVKVSDENGLAGWGEATLEGHTRAVEGTLDEMIELLVGLEAR
jgi:L-alanine-DL-glutamate epimerase-like enolase superfamily enzyme